MGLCARDPGVSATLTKLPIKIGVRWVVGWRYQQNEVVGKIVASGQRFLTICAICSSERSAA